MGRKKNLEEYFESYKGEMGLDIDFIDK